MTDKQGYVTLSNMNLVDSHCHLDRLDLSNHDGKLEHALEAANAVGVNHMLCVCIDLDNADKVREIAERYDYIYASAGIHPTERPGEAIDANTLIRLAEHPRIIAIGETGLDYYRCEGDMHWQHERFITHIDVAKQTGRPLIIHTRQAREDTIRIMREQKANDIGGVMHCFSEDWDMAKKAMDLGFYISFSGIVTFKNAKELHELAVKVPLDRMLIETDSPYLAPTPYRGKPNEPAYVKYVAEHIAMLRDIDVETIANITTDNFFKCFPRASAKDS